MTLQSRLTRIERVLEYIHQHLDEPIHVANLAEKSCWSRWQFQRVFGEATGLTVAQYIRELRLSKAAELLLSSKNKHLDIAISCGFDSEISFCRAFKHMFNCTPRDYRQRGKRYGLRTPLRYRSPQYASNEAPTVFTQIRIESVDAFQIQGKHDWIYGPFSSSPNFLQRVPQIWADLIQTKRTQTKKTHASDAQAIGVIDTRDHPEQPDAICYWAGYQDQNHAPEHAETIHVPRQEYAVIPVHGKVHAIELAVRWFLHQWLPDSNYNGVSGFELEKYAADYDPNSPLSYMEYWLPIEPR
ncbi:AraC family transcriptional regulator [Marinomonas sp. M1K-6]|uniref:AraC family transcriptional regulator n=1 Tax=Marinomonas profundi TaxID=2726122 RepID=A0A847R0Q3_9GAMM|nr:AraC family transcriptional regulator [Marinomonas profundi]NLQ17115.1 AraC family transcriptional regulator [Marinomonas profundi]UDV04688.1 AraC family transcriptional regulator [Marinomonas profundi]